MDYIIKIWNYFGRRNSIPFLKFRKGGRGNSVPRGGKTASEASVRNRRCLRSDVSAIAKQSSRVATYAPLTNFLEVKK